MNSERLEQLFKFLEEDPNDPFLLYAIATEYKTSDLHKAKEYFDLLLKNHSEYVATYYHAADLYNQLNNRDKAEEIYKKGILLAQENKAAHALRELQNAYNEFLFDDD